MLILTIDTTLNKTYITLSSNGKISLSKTIESDDKNYHSAYLTSSISEMLKKLDLKMSDINAIGVNIGPGSFTGIRAGVTVARVIAAQMNIPVVGVSSMEILSCINTSGKKTLVVMDARKQQAYIAIYDKKQTLKEPQTCYLEELKNIALSEDYSIITDTSMSEFLNLQNAIDFNSSPYPLGEYLAQITYEKLKRDNNEYNYMKLKPLYIQPPPISGPGKNKGF